MNNKQTYFYSSKVPFYVKDSLRRYGYKFFALEPSTKEIELIKNNINIIWFENQIDQIINNITEINSSAQKNIIIIDHHFTYHEKIKKLDTLLQQDNVILVGTQYVKNLYNKIKCYNMSSSELWCHHDFIYYMIKKWHKERKPKEESLFLFMAAQKGQERNSLMNLIIEKLNKDILQIKLETSMNLYKKRDQFNSWMTEQFNGSNMLGGFGSGTPRFDLYDRVFCEIVIETVYDTPTVHVTEKVWRPIASGFPCFLLINPANIQYLRDEGYELAPKFLYDDLYSCQNSQEASDIFFNFTKELKQNENLKKEIINMAQNNYKKFWKQKSYWELGVETSRKVFGYCPIDQIMEKLKEI